VDLAHGGRPNFGLEQKNNNFNLRKKSIMVKNKV
jgi:hypothetical protein